MLNLSKSLPKELKQKIESLITQNFRANKNLGQHFLNNPQISDQIALSCGNLSDSAVLEIGPGMGSLTQSIMALHSGVNLTIVEADARFIDILNEVGKFYNNCQFEVIKSDALQYDFNGWTEKHPHKKKYIIANLPYNIGSELLFKWLDEDFLKNINNITLMLQKEFVQRVTAKHHSKAYSWITILAQLLCDVELLFDVPQNAFTPEPKVISSVFSLRPKQAVYPHNIKNLKKICNTLFLYRRKTIRSIINNNSHLHYLLPFLENIQLDLQKRPEEIDIKTFCDISNF